MALIKCPECGKEISDKTQNCINCGYPINSHKVIIENIYGKDFDVSFLADQSISRLDKIIKMLEITGNDREGNLKAKELVFKYDPIKKEEHSNKVHCPRCGSTDIQVLRRWSPFGHYATDQIDRVCVNCKCRF